MVRTYTQVTYEDELKKNPDLKESDVQMLREWCAKQPHLPKISDVQLALFLHNNKYRIERTKSKIDMYCTMRYHVPEFFSDRVPAGSKELRIHFNSFVLLILKNLTHDGYNIYYATLRVSDPSCFVYNDAIKYGNMIYDLWCHFEGSCPGFVMILNAENVTMAHLSRVSLMGLKKYMLYLQEALPVQVKSIHVINVVPAVDIIARVIKPYIKKNIFEKLHLHSKAESLAKFVPLDALPNEDGGKAGNLADLAAETVKWLDDNKAWFQTDEATLRVNESLRPGKGKTSSDLFGVEGSFKMLNID